MRIASLRLLRISVSTNPAITCGETALKFNPPVAAPSAAATFTSPVRDRQDKGHVSGEAPDPVPSLSKLTLALVFVLIVCTMLPVTGVVPVLKQLIQDQYGVGKFLLSTFMSLNMLGALIAAPIMGWISDRYGWTKRILVLAAAADAAFWWAMSTTPSFAVLMGIRFLEGAAHITALSMLLTIVSRSPVEKGKVSRMALLGGGITLGVAIGAPLGGQLAQRAIVAPLQAGALVMAAVAIASAVALPRNQAKPNAQALPTWPKWYAPPALRLPYLFSFVDRLTVGFFVVGFPLFATRSLQLQPAKIGLLIGAFMLPFALLSYPVGRLAERFGLWRFVLGGSFLYGIAFAVVPWVSEGWLLGNMLLCGVLSAVMFGPTLMLVITQGSAASRSSAIAGFNTAGSLGFLIGPLLAGLLLQVLSDWVAELSSYRALFALGALVEIGCVFLACWQLRDRDHEPLLPC